MVANTNACPGVPSIVLVAQGRQGLAFRGAQVDEACVQQVQAAVRQRVLGLFERARVTEQRDGSGNAGVWAQWRFFCACGRAGRSGGVLFVHRFGATLNAHVHLHLCMLDGVVAQRRGRGWLFAGRRWMKLVCSALGCCNAGG